MSKRYMVTHIDGDDGETILAHDIEADELVDVVVDDLMASEALIDVARNDQDRRDALEMSASLNGVDVDGLPKQVTPVGGHTYLIEELPDDPVALDEFHKVRFTNPKLVKFVCRGLPGKLRYEIWPNESQHRGEPHCKVSNKARAATFGIPEGNRKAGDLRPDEAEATKTIRAHGERLLADWYRLRPDDQKL